MSSKIIRLSDLGNNYIPVMFGSLGLDVDKPASALPPIDEEISSIAPTTVPPIIKKGDTYTLYVDDLYSEVNVSINMLPVIANVDTIFLSVKYKLDRGESKLSDSLISLLKDIIANSSPDFPISLVADSLLTFKEYDVLLAELINYCSETRKALRYLSLPASTLSYMVSRDFENDSNDIQRLVDYIKSNLVGEISLNDVLCEKVESYQLEFLNTASVECQGVLKFVTEMLSIRNNTNILIQDLPPDVNTKNVCSADGFDIRSFTTEAGKVLEVPVKKTIQLGLVSKILHLLTPITNSGILQAYEETSNCKKTKIYLFIPMDRIPEIVAIPDILGSWKLVYQVDTDRVEDYKDLRNICMYEVWNILSRSGVPAENREYYLNCATEILNLTETYDLFYLYVTKQGKDTIEYVLPNLDKKVLKIDENFLGVNQLGYYQTDSLRGSNYFF